jgi:hypothetical protein
LLDPRILSNKRAKTHNPKTPKPQNPSKKEKNKF